MHASNTWYLVLYYYDYCRSRFCIYMMYTLHGTYYLVCTVRVSTAIGQVEAACRGRRTEGASFVDTFVLSGRCELYVKGLGKTYMTIDRRVFLLAATASICCCICSFLLLRLIDYERFQNYCFFHRGGKSRARAGLIVVDYSPRPPGRFQSLLHGEIFTQQDDHSIARTGEHCTNIFYEHCFCTACC